MMGIPMEIPFPQVPKVLIDYLNQFYPDCCPKESDSNRAIWIKTGQRSVVNFLLEQHKRQNEEIR